MAEKKLQYNIWDYLDEHRDIKIIRLVRKNYLAVLASKQEAIESQVWKVTDSRQNLSSCQSYPVY